MYFSELERTRCFRGFNRIG